MSTIFASFYPAARMPGLDGRKKKRPGERGVFPVRGAGGQRA